ncbi:MAG: PucR family transcriptional regulator [Tissierellia bacterium]|nr:PucR family transcriptional regulator [Tissierellia bacterium]
MVKLSELLLHRGLDRITYLTSKNMPDKLVKEITVMEVPEVSRWLHGNELVLTSLYAVKDSVDAQIDLIRELKTVNCSGLLVKLGPYVKKLDSSVISIAEELEIPILLIPSNMTYVEIIGSGTRIIHREEEDIFCIENVLRKFLRGQNVDEFELNELNRLFNVSDLGDLYFVNVLSTSDKCGDIFSESVTTYKTRYSKFNVNTIISKNDEDLKKHLTLLKTELSKTYDCLFIVGDINKNILEIKRDFEMLYKVLDRYGEIKREGINLYLKDDIEEYINEYNFYNTKGKRYYQRYLLDLNFEELNTLKAYLKNNFNIMETSEELYLHKNTIRYRLGSIEEKTELYLSNFEDIVKLYYGLKYLEFIAKE